jgi:glycosyltransferase 2 family protein
MRKYRNQILIGLSLAFLIYIGLLALIDTKALIEHLETYPWIILLPVVLLKVISWGLHFLKWQYFLGVIGARDKISVSDSLILFVSSFTLVVSPGKLGEVLKAVVLKAKTDVPIARSVPVVIAERIIDGTSVLTIVFVALLLGGSVINLSDWARLVIFGATAALVVGIIAVQIKPLAYFILDILGKLPLVKRIHKPLIEFYESTREVFQLKHVVVATLLGGLAYGIDAIGMTLVLSGFGLAFTWALFLQTMFIFGLTAAVGALSGSPNGAGTTELSSGGLYASIITPMNPIFDTTAIAAAVLVGGFLYKWLRVLVGMAVALIFRKRLFTSSVESAIAEMEAEKAKTTSYTVESKSA